MQNVVGVSFRPVTKIYYFSPGDLLDLEAGDYVVVDTSQGREVGQVVWNPREMPVEEIGGGLKPVVRRATSLDLVERDRWQHKEPETLAICQTKVAERDLPMNVVSTEYNYDGSRLVVSFTSESRIDFRELVRDLAKTFSTRIEMKQIGVRDEAKVLDGVGKCGRQLCCAGWLRDFAPVTIKMAKNQNLPLNPPEISGVCGRLLCCLAYEMDVYTEARSRLPKVGSVVETPYGKGRVRRVQPLQEAVTVRLEVDDSLRDVGVDELGGIEPRGRGCGCTGCAGRRQTPRRTGDRDEADAEKVGPSGEGETGTDGEMDQPAPSRPRRRRRSSQG
jgi:cell fate regulator YaaT (PSP1 superfamily)